jgi:hypothetical protein
VGVAVVEKGMRVACLGLVDKYLSRRGVERAELKQGGVYSVAVRCSGTLGVWVGMGVRVESVRLSLIGEDSVKASGQDVEFEAEDLARGKRITVEVKGRSEVLFRLLGSV